ncbi:AAA-like domain-containing protein [Laspinema olomoucense]|uniref:AAA-like domain-containing protein n=1 Tax=Laspinema olomoucense D3b TaxID=2953688 RepID=A0ABT2NEG5_9CYAN|nr:AAA-like domain-containing protein [Laspinema sp. D3b]MCT7980130.1 AAA-like domain-containing protein [Laspinema sp. D3b]
MSIVNSKSFYQTEGGTLPLDALTYVEREADEQLYPFGRSTQGNSRVCFVLAPRQTGKSSLMVRTAKRLTEENLICVRINIHEFAGVESERVLWFSLLDEICKQVPLPELNLPDRLKNEWNRHPDLAPGLQFKNFLLEEILSKITAEKLVIFIDEIQDLVDLKLQNVFFGVIRNLSDQTDKPELKKLAFVLLGVAKPSDLMTSTSYTLNLGDRIELGRLTPEQCKPLLPGLKKVTPDPAATLERILYWTGGQPFLTQVVCHLVATDNRIEDSDQIEARVDRVVTEKIITDWRRQDRQSHLQEVENWFTKVENIRKPEKLKTLGLYREILAQSPIDFRQNDPRHWDLLISGLVAKEEDRLQVANQIYTQVFDRNWITKTETLLEDNMPEPFSTIYDRDVFILIDQSASMMLRDADTGDQTRYEYLEEVIMSHVGAILSEQNKEENRTQKICDEVTVYFFSSKRNIVGPYSVRTVDRVKSLFLENPPKMKTFIAPTLEKCIDTWVQKGKPAGRGAFFIIYTDGLFDDEGGFMECIQQAGEKIESHKQVKFIVLGLGQEIDIEKFLDIDFNTNGVLRFNVLTFDLVNEIEDEIIECLERQLIEDPIDAYRVPEWVKREFPDFVEKLKLVRSQNP